MTRLEQAVKARLQEFRDLQRSGVTERTGKTSRILDEAGEERRGERGRGMMASYPELRRLGDRPATIAKAIERGKGKVYRRLEKAERDYLAPYFPAPRKPEKPTVAPHEQIRKCKSCGKPHGKSQHRFHGAGSFHRTHLFSFNPRRKNPAPAKRDLELFREYLNRKGFLVDSLTPAMLERVFVEYRHDRAKWADFEKWKSPSLPSSSLFNLRRRNPRRATHPIKVYGNVTRIILPGGHYDLARKPKMFGLSNGDLWITWGSVGNYPRNPENAPVVRRYGRVKEIQAQKTQRHRCDPGCREMKHQYYHPFTEPNTMVQLRDGSLLVSSR